MPRRKKTDAPPQRQRTPTHLALAKLLEKTTRTLVATTARITKWKIVELTEQLQNATTLIVEATNRIQALPVDFCPGQYNFAVGEQVVIKEKYSDHYRDAFDPRKELVVLTARGKYVTCKVPIENSEAVIIIPCRHLTKAV